MDMMLDIETLGTKPGSIVTSVGAVLFDRKTGEWKDELYLEIDPIDCQNHGLTADASTVVWWMMQSKESQEAFSELRQVHWMPLKFAAEAFATWFSGIGGQNVPGVAPYHVWAQGDMDFQVWGHAMRAVGVEPPWKFRAQRDTRTAYDVLNFDAKNQPRSGVHHIALDDCHHQIKCLMDAINSAKGSSS